MHTKPHWKPDIDLDSKLFYIRRMDGTSHSGTGDIPVARLPLTGFIYVTDGEVLVEADGNPYLCQPGHVLLIPAQCPFSVCYFHDATGYTGGFAASALTDARTLRFITTPLHQAFWFDEGVFMGELFNMLLISFEKNDRMFIEKGLDFFLSRIKSGQPPVIPDTVNRFLESVFNPNNDIKTLASYASLAGISENYLSRQIKQYTGRSVGSWIDIVRTIRAKKLLADSSLPIIDVAAGIGLDDQSYFARFFRRQTGMTPSEFRKAMQG